MIKDLINNLNNKPIKMILEVLSVVINFINNLKKKLNRIYHDRNF